MLHDTESPGGNFAKASHSKAVSPSLLLLSKCLLPNSLPQDWMEFLGIW
jgi:hypothetical protein